MKLLLSLVVYYKLCTFRSLSNNVTVSCEIGLKGCENSKKLVRKTFHAKGNVKKYRKMSEK